MSEVDRIIEDLEQTLAAAPPATRASMLRQLTELFLDNAAGYRPEHVAVYDAVMKRLAGAVDKRALAELSSSLAPVENAPSSTVAVLSRHDDIAVAGPILERSMAISAGDIVDVAKAKGQDHLLAIAGRAQIDPEVSDILVDRGNADVLHKVVDNAGARFSEVRFVRLVGVAKKDKPLAKKLASRTDTPPELQSFLSLAIG
jgi:uncharacterized protein (DUF2336 family)